MFPSCFLSFIYFQFMYLVFIFRSLTREAQNARLHAFTVWSWTCSSQWFVCNSNLFLSLSILSKLMWSIQFQNSSIEITAELLVLYINYCEKCGSLSHHLNLYFYVVEFFKKNHSIFKSSIEMCYLFGYFGPLTFSSGFSN